MKIYFLNTKRKFDNTIIKTSFSIDFVADSFTFLSFFFFCLSLTNKYNSGLRVSRDTSPVSYSIFC